jgi:hypothetical protein
MCDYSLHNLTSRLAKVGDKLATRDFGTGTRGFTASENQNVVVCIRPRARIHDNCGYSRLWRYAASLGWVKLTISSVSVKHCGENLQTDGDRIQRDIAEYAERCPN